MSSFEESQLAVLTVVVLHMLTCRVDVIAPAPHAVCVRVSVKPPVTAPGPGWTLKK